LTIRWSLFLPFAALALSPSPATAEESTALCPERLETEQSIRAPVEGYQAVDAIDKHFWSEVIFYQGRPEKMISLLYETDANTPDHGFTLTWRLDPKIEYWIECQYSSTSIVLRKKLPPVSACEVTYKWRNIVAVDCR